MRADVHRFALKDPSDVSGLAEAIEKGVVDPGKIAAVIGKTHGNGLVNDYPAAVAYQSPLRKVAGSTPLRFVGGGQLALVAGSRPFLLTDRAGRSVGRSRMRVP